MSHGFEKIERDLSSPTGHGEGWYYRTQEGGHDLVRGPHSFAEMKALRAKGLIPRTAMVRQGLRGTWQPSETLHASSLRRTFGSWWAGIALPVLFLVILAAVAARDYGLPFPLALSPIRHSPVPAASFPSSGLSEAVKLSHTIAARRMAAYGLTRAGIIVWTNEARAHEMLPPLRENPRLNMVAAGRVNDMFNRQYFAHRSPSGEGITEMAGRMHYHYRILAENIAQGIFRDDPGVVQGWLQSHGHRKNILSQEVEEIGVGVGKGRLNGEVVWIAVQVFAKSSTSDSDAVDQERTRSSSPRSCERPSGPLREEIGRLKSETSTLARRLSDLKAEIEAQRAAPRSGDRRQEEYPGTAESRYENLMARYNLLAEEMKRKDDFTRDMIAQYNAEVREYNDCMDN